MIKEIEKLIVHLSHQIKSFTELAVIGMSGGADSTLVTILANHILGKENVYTLHMPMNERDNTYFNALSEQVAQHLGVHILKIPITSFVTNFNSIVADTLKVERLSPLNEGNSRARMRMCALYSVCHHLNETTGKRARVLGTGNLSEDYIGYDTKGGDALADIFPIGSLFKSEVYQLLEYFRDHGSITDEMINRTPSAGLWEGQTDEQELGYTYNEMEKSIRKILAGEKLSEKCDLFVEKRHKDHKHKHEASYVVGLREFCN